MPTDILIQSRDDVVEVTLNRPKAINALTLEMCEALLEGFTGWADDDSVASIELRGAGERGFCAGADIRAAREVFLTDPERAYRFFDVEYTLNALLASYPKPITSRMTGVTMGGGMGLATHSPGCRIADETSRIAMPETTIGLWPDVGVLWELSRAPGEIGTWLALSGSVIDASSALYAGLVDEAPGDAGDSALAAAREWIDECFVGDDASAIMDRLASHAAPAAREAGELIATKSPWSVCVALEGLRRAASMASVAEVLDQDRRLAANFVRDSDFIEGVRAQIVDKDRNPRWRHASVENVPRDLVLGMFE